MYPSYSFAKQRAYRKNLKFGRQLLLANAEKDAKEINDNIISEVNKFRGEDLQADDITIITMKKEG